MKEVVQSSESYSFKQAEWGLAWPPAGLQGPMRRRESRELNEQTALLRDINTTQSLCVSGASFFFFLTFNRAVLRRHTSVVISALLKPAQAVLF